MLKSKKVISLLAILSLIVTTTGLTSSAKASSLTQASDTLSTSGVSLTATHTIKFTINHVLQANDYADVVIPGGGGTSFGNIGSVANVACSVGSASTTGVTNARCVAGGTIATGTIMTITLTGVVNPSDIGSEIINLKTYTAGGTVIEKADIMVAILDRVVMTATVLPTLTFTVSGLATSTDVNGMPTTGSSTSNTLAFGNLTVGTSSILGQRLNVATNANNGFKVTVEQNQDLTSNSNSTIDSFKDGAASTTAQAWTQPANLLNQYNTYGHMGVTSNDINLSTDQFTSDTWKGFIGTSPMEVMYHTNPSNGVASNIGSSTVSYRIEISALQEAGDYTNTLTYICTPLF